MELATSSVEVLVVSGSFLVLVPVVVGVVKAIKMANLPSRWAPLASLVLGVVGAFLIGDLSFASALQGIVVGLSASGLYDVGNKTVLGN